MTQDIAEGLGLPGTSGALIADVTPGGPAARGGIQNGDFVLSFDGKPVGDSRALSRVVADTPINKTVGVDLFRKGKKTDGARDRAPAERAGPSAPPPKTPPAKPGRVTMLGLSLGVLDGPARGQFHIAGNIQGVIVTDVAGDRPAADKNIHSGDVIVQVQGRAQVRSPGRRDQAGRRGAQGGQEGRRHAGEPRRRHNLCGDQVELGVALLFSVVSQFE